MIKKNQIIKIEITDITSQGSGVGHHENMAIFVPLTAIGDIVEVKIVKVLKSYAYGIINKILIPSSGRIEVDCPVFAKCGGCAYRHISYDEELKVKDRTVRDAFERIGKVSTQFEPIVGCDNVDRYRNKAVHAIGSENGKIVCGFYARRSHRITPITDCKLHPEEFAQINEFIVDYSAKHRIEPYDEGTHKGILRNVFIRQGWHSGEIAICFVSRGRNEKELSGLANALTERFENIKSAVMNINPDRTNVILGEENVLLAGCETIKDLMCGNIITLSPHSFYQINTAQAEKLYRIVKDYADLEPDDLVIDMYCGAGTIGLSLAPQAREVIGIEIVPAAIENAKKNAQENDISNVRFICADASHAANTLINEDISPDVIVLDPPRKGCDRRTLDAVVKLASTRVVMVSCNPATAARDIRILQDNGYTAVKTRAVDMFPRTGHVETVVLMSRVEK
ncbi:MAG: 23S rRNA (uracil(1939)-C(5))-methyltransferase RlmD [Clostridiales bacterium]|nr:23S rRNA (uracil(1939)-C(5))-methyltransferase RlmD [Clostridiales bacterium]